MRLLGLLLRGVWLLILFAVLYWLVLLLLPELRHAFRVAQLLREPVPVALPMPVEDVKVRGLRDSYGAARSNGRKHEGIDIFAKRGTPVLSTTQGLVIRRGQNHLGGNVVMVLGPGGQRHYYVHLERFSAIKRGDWVWPGAVLGYVGTSGNAAGTPPHLHYGIYGYGGAINPYPLLKGAIPPRHKAPAGK